MAQKRRKLGEILKAWGRITDVQLAEAQKVSEGSRKRMGDVLVEMNYVNETDIAQALASQFEMEYIDVEKMETIDKQNLALLPTEIIKKYLVLPLGKENGRLKVLIHDPMDLETLDNLRFRMNCEIDPALGARKKIKEYIERVFSETKASIDAAVREMTIDHGKSIDGKSIDSGKSIDVYKTGSLSSSLDIKGLSLDRSVDRGASLDTAAGDAAKEAEDSPVVRLVEQMISQAVTMRASDIHIEPFADRVRLRYRIDGVCHELDKIPKRAQTAVIARLKIMAGMKIEEKRIPQDGRIKMIIEGKPVDFRVAACPAYHGEAMVLRILRPDSRASACPAWVMRADTLETFNKVIRRPNGIFLVTGPTGSGKTTTLYSAAQ